ncbi:unextended protein [Plutella xylostella]|uniref:unextended protein n=1 Tax=Plutella xylostella TaxID=51655 RepID=UPI0020324E32|nr:unextended protein [Plutella xylostella]
MPSTSNMLRTCGLISCLILSVLGDSEGASEPWINSFKVENKQCFENNCKYLLNVRGGQFLGHSSWRLTPNAGARGGSCDVIYPNYELQEIFTDQWYTRIQVWVPNVDAKIFFCLHNSEEKTSHFAGKFVHQGGDLFLDPKNDDVSPHNDTQLSTSERNYQDNEIQPTASDKSNLEQMNSNWTDLSHDTDVNYQPNQPRLTREEAKYIEVLRNNKYVPLYQNPKNPHEKDSKQPRKLKREIITANKTLEHEDSNTVEAEAKSKREIVKAGLEMTTPTVAPTTEIHKRQVTDYDDIVVRAERIPVRIEGIRVEESSKPPDIIEGGIPSVLSGSGLSLRVFGEGITAGTVIAFTYDALDYGLPCKFLVKGEYMIKPDSLTSKSAIFEITAPTSQTDMKLYICAKNLRAGVSDPFSDEDKYYHQGIEPWTILATHNKLLPLWATLTLILVCLMFSALFSGLNLGLMSLDRTELKIISNTGTEQERKYARAIMPVRDHGNYLLCSILLGNVAVNSTFTILLDDLTSGLFAVIFSTLSIVLLGEITPQAICSRHGLMVGAKSIIVTKAVMAVTAPLAFPVSKILDYLLGEEIGSVYNRERLKELVKVTTDVNDLDKDEVNIISGALELRKKTVDQVMTKLEDVFMLPIDSVLDFETMSEIVKSGFSRIPVYENTRANIITVLFIKDLAFVDPDDNTPLRTLCQYYQNPCNFVFHHVTLDIMFKHFKDGHKGHMAFVHRINNEGDGDPFYETIGLITLEDVIEEMIQAEIIDETDVFMDNRTKRRRNKPMNKLQDFTAFAERHETQRIHISPQLTLATFQFLSTSVDAFRPELVSETVLRRLLQQDVVRQVKVKAKSKSDAAMLVYQQGKAVDYFVLILEGRVRVTVGREALVFEAGPFTYFGVQALTQNVGVAESPTPSAVGSLQNLQVEALLRHTFVPDYSVRAITDVFYLIVKRSLYMAAKRATLMEKGVLSKGLGPTNEQFDTEVDKLLQSVDEDLSVSGDHKTPSRQLFNNCSSQVSPHPPPASASPYTRATFSPPKDQMDHAVDHSDHADHGDHTREEEEQEKLLK